MMRRSYVAPAIVVALIVAAMLGLQRLQDAPPTRYAAADFTLPDLHGTPVRLSDLRGKVVFLNVWATWCPPCRAEMPSMEALYRRYRDRDFAMLAVSEDIDADVVTSFVRELGLSFPILRDDAGRLPGRYGVTGFPETFIVDRNGLVIRHVVGPEDWDSPEMLAYFDALLDPGKGVTSAR